MYSHTIAIAKHLLTEGRPDVVDRMITPLLSPKGNSTTFDQETLYLKSLLAQARLFVGFTADEVINLFTIEESAIRGIQKPSIAIATANTSMGLAYLHQASNTQSFPRAIYHFRTALNQFSLLNRHDLMYWPYIGLAITLYALNEKTEAQNNLNKANLLLSLILDRTAKYWTEEVFQSFAKGTLVSTEKLFKFTREDFESIAPAPEHELVYASEQMQTLVHACKTLASGKAPVLISGDRGAGKTMLAQEIHRQRILKADGVSGESACEDVFEKIDCASLTSEWYTRDVFFTPQKCNRTLFFDNIECLSESQQHTLLKHLEASSRQENNALRILSGTSADLESLVQSNKFSASLYLHLKICTLEIPALKCRRPDIPLLALHFAYKLQPEGVPRAVLTEPAISALMSYDWPGNVRQLKNEIERLLVHTSFEPIPIIDFQSLSKPIRSSKRVQPLTAAPDAAGEYPLEHILADTERSVIEHVLAEHNGQVSSAADALGLSRQGLYKKLKRLGINPTKFSHQGQKTFVN